MNADTELDATVGRDAHVALDHSVLHFDGAAHRIDHAAKLDQRPVAGALEHTSIVHGDGGIDQFTAQSSEPRQGAILVSARQPAETDDVGSEDRGEFPGFGHGASSTRSKPQNNRQSRFTP